jgi:hypothetical protein
VAITSAGFSACRASYRGESIHATLPPRRTTGVAVQILTLEHFASRLHQTFTVDLGHGKSPFVLIEAKPLAAPALRGMLRAPFSLLFHHVSPVLFPQRIYQMESPGIGDFGVFLVPVARNQDGFVYQAVFN